MNEVFSLEEIGTVESQALDVSSPEPSVKMIKSEPIDPLLNATSVYGQFIVPYDPDEEIILAGDIALLQYSKTEPEYN